jgi:alanine dehydrogenase
MRIGVPRERLPGEGRVGLLAAAVADLVAGGHEVFVESQAGLRSGVSDDQFTASGAHLVDDLEALYGSAELIVKVKEPQPEEVALLREDHILFGFLHLAANPQLLRGLVASGSTAIAYEDIKERDGFLPLLTPMSRIAGRLAVQMGAVQLLQYHGGKGVLLGSDEEAGHVVVIGCGVAGQAAITAAVQLGARVTALDIKPAILEAILDVFKGCIDVKLSTAAAIESAVARADLLVGAVLVPGAKAPCLVRREHVRSMEAGSVIVDVAIDQGGCIETSHATKFDAPSFIEEGVVHVCVTNLPAAVARTASRELGAVSLPYIKQVASIGKLGVLNDPVLVEAVNVNAGQVLRGELQSIAAQ